METPEPLRSLERDHAALVAECEDFRMRIAALTGKMSATEAKIQALEPAIEHYRAKHGLPPLCTKPTEMTNAGDGVAIPAPSVEPSTPEAAESDRNAFTDLEHEERESAVLEAYVVEPRFMSIGGVIEVLERRFSEVSRNPLRLVMERLVGQGRMARVTYGTSSRYVYYGPVNFLRPMEEGGFAYALRSHWPREHSRLSDRPSFHVGPPMGTFARDVYDDPPIFDLEQVMTTP